jgi:hypothetical protein
LAGAALIICAGSGASGRKKKLLRMNLKRSKHNTKKLFCGFLFFVNVFFVYAENTATETNELKYLFSLDTGLTVTALRNLGFGAGVNYEHKLTDFLSIKPGLGHMVCFADLTVVTVDIQLFINYYPLSGGLDKLYIGLGSGCDFIMYPGSDNISNDTAISIVPILGWKWKAFKHLMIEPFVGWKSYLMLTNNYENNRNYLNEGFQWGINFKVFLPNKK